MILKYKNYNGAWTIYQLNQFTYIKLNISNYYNETIANVTKNTELLKKIEGYHNNFYYSISSIFETELPLHHNGTMFFSFKTQKDTSLSEIQNVILLSNKDKIGQTDWFMISESEECYILTDDGKTIERLI